MKNPLTPEQEAALVAAIQQAEVRTSGEIRVHLEDTCPTPEPLDRAAQVFAELNMHRTTQRNGSRPRLVATTGDVQLRIPKLGPAPLSALACAASPLMSRGSISAGPDAGHRAG